MTTALEHELARINRMRIPAFARGEMRRRAERIAWCIAQPDRAPLETMLGRKAGSGMDDAVWCSRCQFHVDDHERMRRHVDAAEKAR